MSDVEVSEKVVGLFEEPPLTVREHMDPDKHWIGETLPAPTQSEIAGTVGITSGPGDSPFPARADHTHKLDGGIFPVFDYYSPSGNDDATTSATLTPWMTMPNALSIPSWAKSAIVQLNISNCTNITAACTYALSVTIGSTPITAVQYAVVDFTGVAQPRSLSFAKDVVLTGTGTQSIVIYASRMSGTGILRANTFSKISTVTFYKP